MTTTSTDRTSRIGDVGIKAPCRATTTAAITLNGEQTVDGVALVTGDRCLVKNQSSSVDNGIYVVDTGAWSRSNDFDGSYDAANGTLIKVNSGTANSGFWYCAGTDPIEVGTDAVTFSQASTVLAVVSAFMQTMLDDTTAAAARTTLGSTTVGDAVFIAATAAAARSALVAAASGANTDITSLNAPALGAATATTQASSDNSTKVATTAMVQALVQPPVRQTVLSAYNGATALVDSNGLSAFGGSTGSTIVTVTGTLKASAAAGGDANYTGSIVNPSWTGLTASAYLYLDITSGGVVTTGSTTLAPVYQWGGTYSTTNLQNTFNIQEMTMKVGNGSTASQVYRVFVGEVTASGTVSVITWYQLMRRYQSALTAIPSASTRTVFSHNIGIDPRFLRGKAFIRFVTGWNGYVAGQVVPFTTYYSGTNPPALDANILESTLVAAILNNTPGVQIQTQESAPNSYAALPTGSGTAQCFVDVRSDW